MRSPDWAVLATQVFRAPVLYTDAGGGLYAFPLSYAMQCEDVTMSAWANLAEYEQDQDPEGPVALKLLEYGSPEDPLFELQIVDKGIVYAALSPMDPACVCKWASDATGASFIVLPKWRDPCGLPPDAQIARKFDAMERLLPLVPRRSKGYYRRSMKELEEDPRDIDDTLMSMVEEAGIA